MAEDIEGAVAVLRAGGVVAFPTETVYGLGADARSDAAVARVFSLKGRPVDHPLIVHLADASWMARWADPVPPEAATLAARFWPGPMTLILRRRDGVSDAVTGGQPTVGLRVPAHPLAHRLLEAFGDGLAAPSANRFGNVSPTTAAHVRAELGADVDRILDGGPSEVGVESTIVDLSGDAPRILRPGGVSREAIEAVLGREVPVAASESVRAPGTLPSHYAPRARLELVAEEALTARARELLASGARVAVLSPATLSSAVVGVEHVFLPREPDARARRLYAALRELDERGLEVGLVAGESSDEGLHLAIADRLRRASAPRNDDDDPLDQDDPRARFSGTVDDYVRYRPDYPPALFDWIASEASLAEGDVVVDVGCGTGIASRQLAARGLRVIGVDPNADMLAAAQRAGGPITYVESDAEVLAIDDWLDGPRSVAAITAGQAFHWFDLERALPRFRALLRPGGRIVAFFNLRDDTSPAMAAYDAVLRRFCPEYAEVGAEPRAAAIAARDDLHDLHRLELAYGQRFDRAGLSGRAWSSSYVRRQVRERDAFERALDELFEAHAVEGRYAFAYRTVALSFI